MSDSCHVNPLQQLNGKQPSVFNTRIGRNNTAANGHPVQYNGANNIEQTFLNQNVGMKSHDDSFGQQVNSPALMNPIMSDNNVISNDNWVNQFATMQMKDPLEFSDAYKKYYEQYSRSSTVGNTVTNIVGNKSIPNNNTSMSQPILRPQLNRNIQSHFSMQANAKIPLTPVANSAPIIDTGNNLNSNELNSYFDLQFKAVEEEINEIAVLNEEQIQFQKAAQGILNTLSPKDVEIELTTSAMDYASDEKSMLRDKLTNSKFMGLMKRVSGGVVTMKENNKELYTPKDNKLEGNEYFPIS